MMMNDDVAELNPQADRSGTPLQFAVQVDNCCVTPVINVSRHHARTAMSRRDSTW